MIKVCKKCHKEKDYNDFSNDFRKIDKKQSHCKACKLKWAREYRKKHPEKTRLAVRKTNIYRRYKITLEEYNYIYKKQGGVCAICGKSPNGHSLHIDHNHKNGKIRKFLCRRCNSVLGYVEEDINLLKKLIEYLLLHNIES